MEQLRDNFFSVHKPFYRFIMLRLIDNTKCMKKGVQYFIGLLKYSLAEIDVGQLSSYKYYVEHIYQSKIKLCYAQSKK